jgi:RTX calcium-binding nonapeptide repeat (4 copies)
MLTVAIGVAVLSILAFACVALGKASHVGWPRINGVLRMNNLDQSRPLSGHPNRHNELLGGHGSDTISAGGAGDVIWGDYKPCCQPSTQVDHLYGGPGRDFIYASHGVNFIYTGGGRDVVHAHFGRGGEIHCDSPQVLLYISHRSRGRYRLFGCHRLNYKPERMRRG